MSNYCSHEIIDDEYLVREAQLGAVLPEELLEQRVIKLLGEGETGYVFHGCLVVDQERRGYLRADTVYQREKKVLFGDTIAVSRGPEGLVVRIAAESGRFVAAPISAYTQGPLLPVARFVVTRQFASAD